jgi:hypothetical protein
MKRIRSPFNTFSITVLGMFVISLLLPREAFGQTFGADAAEGFLYDLPDVRFETSDFQGDNVEGAWNLKVRQPLDHNHPENGSFYQRVYLSHRAADLPVVMVTEGYSRGFNYQSELADAMGANQVIVEHRYYGESVPDSMDYDFLNIRQAARDLHRIRTLLGEYYSGPWVASGISKGGQTTLFYRYFFPDDVAAIVPYVAPINLSLEDERIYLFLNEVGKAKCRKRIEAIQQRILEDYDASLLRLKWHAKGAGYRFDYLTVDEAFEYAVLEYPFSFWQWGADCDKIPDSDESLEVILDHFLEVSGLEFFSDDGMTDYASHYYQCAVEFGYYGYEVESFAEKLRVLGQTGNPSAIFTPEHMTVQYDGGELAKAAYDWLESEGDEIIYINGALDTWSATAMPFNVDRDALYYFLEDESHGTARIRNMSESQRGEVRLSLERWLGIELTGTLAD